MGYSTPFTAVAGTAWKAADWNVYGRDNIAWIATDSPACRIYNSVAFSHNSSGNWLAVTCDSERFDNSAMHSTSSNTARMTIPTGGGGKYVLGGSGAVGLSATGQKVAGMGINGLATFAATQGGAGLGTGAIFANLSIMCVYSMAVADYAQLAIFQDSGGTLSVSSFANYSPEAYAFWFRN